MKRMKILFLIALFGFFNPMPAASGAPPKPRILMLSGSREYKSEATLKAFKQFLESRYHVSCTISLGKERGKACPLLDTLQDHDVLFVFCKRMNLPPEALAHLKQWFDRGKPVIGVRTASHAFQTYLAFDHDILGGDYKGHDGLEKDIRVRFGPHAAAHPILEGIQEWRRTGKLYHNRNLRGDARVLLTGHGKKEPQPLAWARTYNPEKKGRAFYTSMGFPHDFDNGQFQQLLVNAIGWTTGKKLQTKEKKFVGSAQFREMTAKFAATPHGAKPWIYWLWLNGYVNKAHIAKELNQFRDAGIGGVLIFDMGARGDKQAAPPAGPAFMSDECVDNIAYTLKVAEDLGLAVQLAVSSSWDMGGTWVKPEHASMRLYWSELSVEGPRSFDQVLPLPKLPAAIPRKADGAPAFLKNVAVLAVPDAGKGKTPRKKDAAWIIEDPSAIINLTDTLSADGRIRWQAPAGRWRILRFVCANTGEKLKVPSPASNGLATDHFNAQATRTYLKHITNRLTEKLGDLGKTSLKQLYLPSYEVRGATWTPDFIDQFKHYCRYDITPFLPVLTGAIIKDKPYTDRFLFDYHKMLGDLLVDAYYRTASQVAREAGLGIEAEAGGPGPPVHNVPVDALKALGAIDEMRGEFWPWRMDNHPLWVVKETACAAHIYGRKKVHMEAFTGFFHWWDGPAGLKPSADRAFCEGMNHVVWHTATHQPPEAGRPGWVYGAGTHLTPNLIWWPKAKPFIDYLSRCSYMLQQGLFVADVCYYYGDKAFNFVPPKHIDPNLGFGFDYDVINADALLNRMQAKDGKLVLPDGMQYEVLVLPDDTGMSIPVLEKIAALVKAGATVVGSKPRHANGLSGHPQDDARIRQLADTAWDKVVRGGKLRQVLGSRGIGPDFQCLDKAHEKNLDYIHRRTQDADIYFLRNKSKSLINFTARFRVPGKVPEIWCPVSGARMTQHIYKQLPDGVEMPCRLYPSGSTFVVFRPPGKATRKSAGGKALPTIAVDGQPSLTINSPWNMLFWSNRGSPRQLFTRTLQSWTDIDLPDIRYYSGKVSYHTTFEFPENWHGQNPQVTLDLGNLWLLGEVFINRKSQGVLWTPPFRTDITQALKPGKNELIVVIYNTWCNRLIGDALLPKEKRSTRTNITGSGTPRKSWKNINPRPSGLFGPVKLLCNIPD